MTLTGSTPIITTASDARRAAGYALAGLTRTYRATGAKRHDVQALRGIDLQIDAGEYVAIQGPTGGGKSTLMLLLGGLDAPTSGTVRLGELALSGANGARLAKARAERIGFVFQAANLIPTLTAQENVETALVPLGVPAAERAERARATLEQVGLGDRADHLPTELSGGQQQRVAIARAIVKRPSVLLADEPTGALDESTRDEIIGLLERLRAEHDVTLVLVTHDRALAERADRRVRVAEGRIADDVRRG
ncbi:ABC transporter ATP-binding protein [Agrococcus jejuensis]|uniref:Putative ABC transport system ATP-binding protein n=1 Tax=Agrococcus jejuensis TaxID=399736 RepID=A0A1G8FFD5_9MICO|nr:ABC transporter ATP-binding protein [Agrococcus jejuensis]SDH80795.1 putative ABC transport system ATP-binding protein [Agrococcus jejuensis]